MWWEAEFLQYQFLPVVLFRVTNCQLVCQASLETISFGCFESLCKSCVTVKFCSLLGKMALRYLFKCKLMTNLALDAIYQFKSIKMSFKICSTKQLTWLFTWKFKKRFYKSLRWKRTNLQQSSTGFSIKTMLLPTWFCLLANI